MSEYVYIVRDDKGDWQPGLLENLDAQVDKEEVDDEERLVPDGKRVICSVGGVEAIFAGYIDCIPAEMLVDSGTW